jgi:hypothetical protein
MKRTIGAIGVLLTLLLIIALPASTVRATDDVDFELYYGTGNSLYIEMETPTPGAIIFFTLGVNYQGYLADPTHVGSTPGYGTTRYYGRVPISYGSTFYFSAVAWTEAGGDSSVTYCEQHNPNW